MATAPHLTPDEPSSAAAASDPAADKVSSGAGMDSPLDDLESQVREWMAYAAHYYAAQSDLFRWRLLRFVVSGASLAALLLAALAAVGTAAVFVMRGAAHGLAAALGNRIWAGELIVGLSVFLLLVVGQRALVQKMRHDWWQRIDEKYAQNRQRQQAAFGRDAREAAAERRSG